MSKAMDGVENLTLKNQWNQGSGLACRNVTEELLLGTLNREGNNVALGIDYAAMATAQDSSTAITGFKSKAHTISSPCKISPLIKM